MTPGGTTGVTVAELAPYEPDPWTGIVKWVLSTFVTGQSPLMAVSPVAPVIWTHMPLWRWCAADVWSSHGGPFEVTTSTVDVPRPTVKVTATPPGAFATALTIESWRN